MESLPLSPSAQAIMSKAAEESEQLGHHFLGVEHVFLALAANSASLADSLEGQNVSLQNVATQLRERTASLEHRPTGPDPVVSPRCQSIISLATRIARRQGHSQLTDEHLLEAIVREDRSVPMRILRSLDVDVTEIHDLISKRPAPKTQTELPLLERFGRDLTEEALRGTSMPVIGREIEMDLVSQILLRKKKNNPVLVGEAGVGKTAVVEGLAGVLTAHDEKHPLAGARIIELSVASLLAGTKYRGDFEARVTGILAEAASDPRIVLFIDEIHTLMGAGASSGEAVGASEIVKPALARGEIRCIGATTIREYRRHIERDAALERRFEPVMVEEPTPAMTQKILQGVVPALGAFHQVEFAPDAIEAALGLTVRYVPNRRLPDKAIDVLDQAGARRRLSRFSRSRVPSNGPANEAPPAPVDADDIARTVAQWTGIPVEKMSSDDAGRLLALEDELRTRVVGQDHACRAVARAIITSRAGLADPDRPAGVFLFMGPTGVGKTELAKALAELLFGDPKKLLRFDMSEYMEPHSVAKLIGAPPGYVGHEGEGLLVSAVRTHPHSVVLLDEIEKAHPQVFDLFLQVFDDGRLTDAHGATADFRNAVVILTSNLRFEIASEPRKGTMGFDVAGESREAPEPPQVEVDPRKVLAEYLRPELVNRIDDILVFRSLGAAEIRVIIDRLLADLEALVASRNLAMLLDDDVYDFLIERGVSEQFGARELRRAIDRHLRQPLAQELLRRGDSAGSVRVRVNEDRIDFV